MLSEQERAAHQAAVITRPHLVMLGAGASRACVPDGDRAGIRLPVLNDLVDLIDIGGVLDKCGVPWRGRNFEDVYAALRADPKHAETATRIETSVESYFGSLELPSTATLYDRLLLSLQDKDVVATFNWDPLLMQAYERNRRVVPLPRLYFLHGNVAVAECETHDCFGPQDSRCNVCNEPMSTTPLIYPLPEKDYESPAAVRRAWQAVQVALRDAFCLTIFGYSAPASDAKARALMSPPWRSNRLWDSLHIEVIDIKPSAEICATWNDMIPYDHIQHVDMYDESFLALFPRRTCAAKYEASFLGQPADSIPLPATPSLDELQMAAKQLQADRR